jgi:hypothetical protein
MQSGGAHDRYSCNAPARAWTEVRGEKTPRAMEDHKVTTTGEMSCRELVESITEFLEGAMPHDDPLRLEQHLEECPYCQNYLDQMRQTIEALGHLSEESIAPRARDELLAVFRDWRAGQ